MKILFLLPLKSLHTSKRVSKSWLHLITTDILKLPLPPIGHFIQDGGRAIDFFAAKTNGSTNINVNVDSTLSFLPLQKWVRILDSCNGLILCSTRDHYWQHVYYVCNPVTKSWAELPENQRDVGFEPSVLGFEPWVSPHYAVLSIEQRRGNAWTVYSSKTGTWGKRHALGRDILCSNWNKTDFTVWNSDAYVVSFRPEGAKVKRVCLETMRVPLSDQGTLEPIRFPKTVTTEIRYVAKVKPATYIGRLAGELCFAHFHGLGLVVWRRESERNEWVLKHASNLEVYLDPKPVLGCSILAFHSTLEFVYILHNGMVYSYDLNTLGLEKVCDLGVRDAQAFQFSPCLFDVFG